MHSFFIQMQADNFNESTHTSIKYVTLNTLPRRAALRRLAGRCIHLHRKAQAGCGARGWSGGG